MPSSAESMPPRMMSSTFSTPACPLAAEAPEVRAADHHRASAQGERLDHVATAAHTAVEHDLDTILDRAGDGAGTSRIVAGVPSRLLPPWLETEMAVTPASAAWSASSTRVIPLSIERPVPDLASQATSSQVGGGVCIHWP